MKKENSLQANALGTAESIIMGIAGSAPAFSIEATAFTIIGIAGVLSPASILASGLIMFGIAWAFIHLNRLNPSAGTSFTWVSLIFGSTAGFFAGWALLVLCCIFMVSATVPAANALLLVFAPQLVNQVHWVTMIAAVILALVSLIVMKGIKMTSAAQIILTIIEAVILLLIIVLGFYHFSTTPAHPFSWEWFAIQELFSTTTNGTSLFVSGALISLFFYYGWDVSMNLAEETKDPNETPSRATFWTMIFLMLFFLVFIVLILLALTDQQIAYYNTNVIFAMAEKLLGKELGYLAIIAVLLSTIGTIETQILQFTRTLFAKGRAGALDARYSRIHEKWQTPYIAILIIWGIGTSLLFASSYLPSVNEILEKSISAMSYQICFYLGLTGFACAWHFRKSVVQNFRSSLTQVWWPLASALFLCYILLISVATSDTMTNIVGLGGIVIGMLPFVVRKMLNHKHA